LYSASSFSYLSSNALTDVLAFFTALMRSRIFSSLCLAPSAWAASLLSWHFDATFW